MPYKHHVKYYSQSSMFCSPKPSELPQPNFHEHKVEQVKKDRTSVLKDLLKIK